MILGIGMKRVTCDLVPAEHMFYLVRAHAPDAAVNMDHLRHFHQAILNAGGFSTELEEVLDIVEARRIITE